MRELLVIGMGPGHPDQITVQAVQALNRVVVFFRIDKGDAKSGLNAAREQVLRRHVSRPGYRVVDIPEPPRDRSPALTAAGYQDAVHDWHEARALVVGAAIAAELGEDGVGAFLVWGDPSLYDSTLRIVDRLIGRGAVAFEYTVIPGVTSVQALAAAHRVPLNRVGEPVHITPARRLAGGLPQGLDSAVVMLDPGFTAAGFDDPALTVFWGGLPQHAGRDADPRAAVRGGRGDHRDQGRAAGTARLDHGHLPALARLARPARPGRARTSGL